MVVNDSPWGRFFPLLARNHVKLFVVDKKAAWVGGINLTDQAFENFDLMVKFDDQRVVSRLWGGENGGLNLGRDYRLLSDTGRWGKSGIYEAAMEMAGRAQSSVLYVSQFVPEGRLLNRLIGKAKSGVAVEVMTSNPEDEALSRWPYKLWYRSFKKRTMGIANIKLIHGSRKVHAKYLGVDLREGMFGSHNLFWPLALIGTKEIMIYCTNKALIRQIETWVSGEILQ